MQGERQTQPIRERCCSYASVFDSQSDVSELCDGPQKKTQPFLTMIAFALAAALLASASSVSAHAGRSPPEKQAEFGSYILLVSQWTTVIDALVESRPDSPLFIRDSHFT